MPLWSMLLPLWSMLLSAVGSIRPLDGTFTIVNKANGWRMFASPKLGLFVIDDSGPIYQDQMWLFAPQENDSYAVINAANGMRVLAQFGADGEHGFFAVDDGPIYQDQRWRLSPQKDGSYLVVNVKSGRRILSRIGDNGKQRFAAVADSGPVQPDETWWLINQEMDETARLVMELEVEQNRVSMLTEATAVAENMTSQLTGQLEKALDEQRKLKLATQTQRHQTLTTASKLKEVQASKEDLAREFDVHRSELMRLQAEVLIQKQGKDELLGEARAQHVKLLKQKLKLEGSVSTQAQLVAELEAVNSAKRKLIDTISVMQSQVTELRMQLDAMSEANLELTSKAKILEGLPRRWMPSFDIGISSKLLVTVLAIVFIAGIAACSRRHFVLLSDVRVNQKRIAVLERELHAEIGNMVRVGDFDGGLGADFGFCAFNAEINQESVRLIKVQCPGVKHADVEIELIFNGCEVTIHRQASRGVASTMWKRSFQFKPSDGLFEFREEQMVLEDGFLQLVFRACAFQNRRVLFPRHFSLTDSDADACWDYSAGGDGAEDWWHDLDGSADVQAVVCKQGSLADGDTESTASTARALV